MRIPIIYGRSNYCRKVVKPQDLGIITPLENVKQFELTQTYGHLYMIPMLPLGSAWHARGKDGKLYETNEVMREHLHQIRSAWFTILLSFMGPIVILTVFAIYKTDRIYTRHQQEVYETARLKKEYEERMAYITHPAIDDYYDFDGENRSEHAKVIGYNDSAVQLSVMMLDRTRMAEPQVIRKLTDTTNTFSGWVSKQTLKGIAKEGAERKDIPLLGAGTFRIYEIIRLGEPILEHGGTANMNSFAVGIRNRGKNLIVTAVTGATTNDSLPWFWNYEAYCYFDMPKGNGERFSFTFTCEDEKGKTFRYKVNGKKDRDPEITIIKQP
jgi:hypothetical protein